MSREQALRLLKTGILYAGFGVACSVIGLMTNQDDDTFFLIFRVLLTATLSSLIIILIKYQERRKRA